jgi:peptide/nickel transport system substrate-binding protein
MRSCSTAYEGLTRYTRKYEPEPALATKWTFDLAPRRSGSTCARACVSMTAAPFTADDVVFSFGRIKSADQHDVDLRGRGQPT